MEIWREIQTYFSAEVLDENNQIFTHEDDEYYGLKLKSCVGNQSLKRNKHLKKRLKRKEKKHQRRRGKRFCCKKGIHTTLGKIPGTCENPKESIFEHATETFGITENLCNQVFQACCNDKIVGKAL